MTTNPTLLSDMPPLIDRLREQRDLTEKYEAALVEQLDVLRSELNAAERELSDLEDTITILSLSEPDEDDEAPAFTFADLDRVDFAGLVSGFAGSGNVYFKPCSDYGDLNCPFC